MKIGIITFHWATNYGAVLQTYCLQSFLERYGHVVEIINYKPKKYDFSYLRLFLDLRNWKNIRSLLIRNKKEKIIDRFRVEKLHITKRYYSSEELTSLKSQYDIVISGSDQIMNPSFTLYGEDEPTSAYFLTFCDSSTTKKVGYAVSFGCERYPERSAKYATNWINNFDAISVREQTGIGLLKQLSYRNNATLVPDPTLLMGADLFKALKINFYHPGIKIPCIYTIRQFFHLDSTHTVINETKDPPSVEKWLQIIATSSYLITDSYHGMIVALLSHVPFVVLLENSTFRGMNDRFSTLLRILDLEYRMISDKNAADSVLATNINWNKVDTILCKFRTVGITFLNENTNESSMVE